MSNEPEVIEQPAVVAEFPIGEPNQTVEIVEIAPEVPVAETKSYTYQPTDENGRALGGKQVIKYTSETELIQKLEEQNVLLVRKLRSETRKNRLGLNEYEAPADADTYQPIEFNKKELSPDDRVRLSRDLLDPERFSEATDTLFEATLGQKPEQLRQTLQSLQDNNLKLQAKNEADAFMQSTPDYYRCDDNAEALVSWMVRRNLNPTRENYRKAYDDLTKNEVLLTAQEVAAQPAQVPPPEVPVAEVVEPVPAPPATPEQAQAEPVRPAPSRIPTGLTRNTSADVVVSRPAGDDIEYEVVVNGQKRVYRGIQALDAMPGDVLKHRTNHEKGFAQKAEKLWADQDKKRNKPAIGIGAGGRG